MSKLDKSTFVAIYIAGQFILITAMAIGYAKKEIRNQQELLKQSDTMKECVEQNLKEPLTCFDKENL